jgi:hypothetical protein
VSPQGVPKELLEAKKLELRQEKVILLSLRQTGQVTNYYLSSWMRRRLPRKLVCVKNRSEHGKRSLRA